MNGERTLQTISPLQQHAHGLRHAFNGVIFALVIFAVLLGATTGWMRYTKKRTSGIKDAAQQTMGGLMPEVTLAAALAPIGVRQRFICPQCGSYCVTSTGSPMCPFCKQPMVPEVPGIVAAAGVATADVATVGTTSIVPIQAGVKAAHANRGVCANCHLVVRTANTGLAPMIEVGMDRPHRNRGTCTTCHSVMKAKGIGPVPTITADAVPPHPDRGLCANCHIITNLKAAVLNAVALIPAAARASPAVAAAPAPTGTPGTTAAPSVPTGAVKPILLKPFGMEVCTANGGGAKVTGVMGNSNASKAGLAVGDIIVELDGKKATDADGLMRLVSVAAPEASVQLRVVRNAKLHKVAILVGEGEMEGATPIPMRK